VAGRKRAAVASNPFAAKGDYVKSSRATIRAAIAAVRARPRPKMCDLYVRKIAMDFLSFKSFQDLELIPTRLHKAPLWSYIILKAGYLPQMSKNAKRIKQYFDGGLKDFSFATAL